MLATLLLEADGLQVMPLVIVAVVVAYVTTAHLTPAPGPAVTEPRPDASPAERQAVSAEAARRG
jgi:hypothetical protein